MIESQLMDDRRRKINISVNWSSKLCKGGVTFLLWHVSGGKRNGLFLRKSAYSMLENNGAPTVTNFSSSYVTIRGKSSREEQLNFSVASPLTSSAYVTVDRRLIEANMGN